MVGCGVCACDSGCVPLAIGPTAYSGGVSLDESLFTVITEQGIDLVARLRGSEHASIFQHRGLPARHCSLFAGESQVIVAGHVVPLSILMPDHHHTVLS